MVRILQADPDETFRREIADYCAQIDNVHYYGLDDSTSYLTTISQVKPNLILLALELAPEDGLSLLRKTRELWCSIELPIILCATKEQEPTVLEKAAVWGANYMVLRPVDLRSLEHRVRELLEIPSSQNDFNLRAVQEICLHYFEQLGVPPHYKGYRYLLEGVCLAWCHPDWLNSVTDDLYPAIARRFSTSGSQVERTMRYALERTWERGNLTKLYEVFPYEVRESKGKPTNSSFIAKMVDLVDLEIRRHG